MVNPSNWLSQASLATLQRRAKLLSDCRSFFSARQVMEVDVPLLGETGVTDPHIECFQTRGLSLQSSPEFYMKRLLAGGCGDIYSLGRAFRLEEAGRRHSPEFTLLEWYRLGFDDHALAEEVVELIYFVSAQETKQESQEGSHQKLQSHFVSYGEIFELHCGLNPHRASVTELQNLARQNLGFKSELETRSAWLDLIFSHIVEPAMGIDLWVVQDFPACQSALARTGQSDGESIAHRFEVYWRGLELANGYWELADKAEQAARFEADLALRSRMGKSQPAMDNNLLAALDAGLPECAGVALGIDRLLMCICELNDIKQVQTFPFPG